MRGQAGVWQKTEHASDAVPEAAASYRAGKGARVGDKAKVASSVSV